MARRARCDLLATAAADDPGPALAAVQRAEAVYWDPALGTWIATRWDDVAALLRDPACSVDRGGTVAGLGDPACAAELAWCSAFVLRWMVFADAPHHTRVRAAVQRVFSAARLRDDVAAAVADRVGRLAAAGGGDVMADVALPVPAAVTTRMLGLPASDTAMLKRWTGDMFALFGAGVASGPVIRAAYRSLTECRRYFAELVAARRRRPGDDLISALVAAPAAAELDDDDRVDACATLVAGATETTTHVVGNALWALWRHPAQLAQLQAAPELAAAAVEETFRWDSPAFAVMRRATTAMAVGGVTVPAGDRIYCVIYAANRDPARHPDPERFALDRRDHRHLGLGHGHHFCLGAALARFEATAMVRALIAVPGLRLDVDALAGGRPRYVGNMAVRGLAALPVACG